MKRFVNITIAGLFLIIILGGCTAKQVHLTYQPSINLEKLPTTSNKKIVLFSFVDNREDIAPDAYGTMTCLVDAILPIAFYKDMDGNTDISYYVTKAFKDELKALGFDIESGSTYSRAISFRDCQKELKTLDLGAADKIIIGRIRFFRWTQAGFAGALFQGMMPKPGLNAEIQLQVVNTNDLRVVWAGSGWALVKSSENMPEPTEIENKIRLGLNQVLTQVISNKDFLQAISN